MNNAEISSIKTYKFKVRMKLKTCPYIKPSLKKLCIEEIEKVKMQLTTYYKWSDIATFSEYLGKCIARITTCLSDNNVDDITIGKVKSYILQLRL